jgi:hypothetical protein
LKRKDLTLVREETVPEMVQIALAERLLKE